MLHTKTLIITGVLLISGISAGFCFGPPQHRSPSVGASPEKRAAIKKSLDLYTQGGDAMEIEKNYPKAEALFRQALALNPSNPFLKQGLGDALSAQGKDKQAWSVYGESIHPTGTSQSTEYNPLALNRYREVCRAVGDVGEASWAERQMVLQTWRMFDEYPRITEEQLGSVPVSTMAKLSVGLAYDCLGEDAKALTFFTQAVEEEPDLALAHLYRGQSLRKLGFGATAAKAEYKKAYQLGDAKVRAMAQERLK